MKNHFIHPIENYLKYFSDKLKSVSKIPFSRFDKEGGSSYEMDASGMMRDEIKFSKFINRLRSIFQEILVKPIYQQMVLNHPELKNDFSFKAGLNKRLCQKVNFHSFLVFESFCTFKGKSKPVSLSKN